MLNSCLSFMACAIRSVMVASTWVPSLAGREGVITDVFFLQLPLLKQLILRMRAAAASAWAMIFAASAAALSVAAAKADAAWLAAF